MENSDKGLTENSRLVYSAGNAAPAYDTKEEDSPDPVNFLPTPCHYGKVPWAQKLQPYRTGLGSAEVHMLKNSPVPAVPVKILLRKKSRNP